MPKFKIVDLFAGVGGWSVAGRHLGVPVVGVEWCRHACQTRRAAGLATVEEDVRKLSPSDFPTENVLVGHPPAQAFIVPGRHRGRTALTQVLDLVGRMSRRDDVGAELVHAEDERTGLVLEPLRWALAAIDEGRAYDVIALVQSPSNLPLWEAMGEALAAEGYSVASGLLRAEQFGVPQTRRTAVMIARLGGVAVLPRPTHHAFGKGVPRGEAGLGLLPWVPMGEALSRPHPFEMISNYGLGGDPTARSRRTSAEPAFTVTGKIRRNRVVTPHGSELPRLTDSEAGQLQTFPRGFPWAGQGVAQQIGNAVQPLLAAHVLAAALDLPAPTPQPASS
ncbi:DNA cytosine methyltransferase [Streptomyces sp. MB09-01]|uniref:DNA cytosine methyltransferase n=1 Tax=Streptomyces sp. MB09-01 TaxID=3028666 RepID=UPI0029B5CB5F|nr:DNA cytosine methyltransferase [Streptomyces sp. MB09-01]MDX3539812.1 DNA cytosine methyltransferase [Streptomyces sp. MB09-01]